MPEFKLAHLREQGQNMIIFPLDRGIHHKTDEEKQDILDELEQRANNAGLAGGAVLVWEYSGRMHFIGPRAWHPFLKSINMQIVMQNINQKISW